MLSLQTENISKTLVRMRRSIRNINIRAFEHFLSPWSREFDVKGHPGGGEFEPEVLSSKYLFGLRLPNARGSSSDSGFVRQVFEA